MTTPFRPRLTPLADRLTPAVTFRFDYSQDTAGFFTAAARAELERAAADLGTPLTDSLAAITPAAGESWTAFVTNPATGATVRATNLAVAADELVVYVGSANFRGSTLGITSPGTATARGSAAFSRTVQARGQDGALANPATDFAPWGGISVFDTSTNWSFDPAGPVAGRIDFYSVALHELGHVLGIGTSEAFTRLSSGGRFVGAAATAEYGGSVPLSADRGHFAGGVVSAGREAAMAPAVTRGVRKPFTPLDWAALTDIGWQVGPANTPAPPPAPVGTGDAVAVVGADAGGGPAVRWLDADGQVVVSRFAFDAGFTGGVRVAAADFDGDGTLDVLAGTGPGIASRVRVLSGKTGVEQLALSPFEGSFAGGVFVAAGDLTGDGVPDVIVSADRGGGPRVRVFDGDTGAAVADFFGIDDTSFRGGARVAVGDVDGDGASDLLVAAGAGGGPRVAGFSGDSVAAGSPTRVFADFFAFADDVRDGVYLAAGDLDADGAAEVIVGAGPGGGPRVLALSGAGLAAGRQTVRADFFAGDASSRSGVRVAVADLDDDGRPDLITGAGAGSGVAGYSRRTLSAAAPTPAFAYSVFPDFAGGVFVG